VLSNATSELIDFFSHEAATLIVYDFPETGVDIELCRYRGLKGILYQEAPIDHLFRCLDAVSNNDMWLPRKLMVKMLNEFRPYAINYQELNTTLTKREQQTLERIIQGQSNLEIAEALFVAESTVKTHVYKLYKKLNVRCRKEVINKVSNQFFEHSNWFGYGWWCCHQSLLSPNLGLILPNHTQLRVILLLFTYWERQQYPFIMRLIPLFIAFFLTFASLSHAESTKYSESDLLDRPLMERYIIDELKSLRQDQQDLERRLTIQMTDRELAVADKSLNYANVTVTYFFYIIAGVASLIAFVGWQSLREFKNNTKEMADKRLEAIAGEYEKKFSALERDLKRKTRIISENNKEIERINEIHNLWLRAQSMPTAEQRIDVYDEIVNIRPGDLEALT